MRRTRVASILHKVSRDGLPPARLLRRLRVADLEIDALEPRIMQGTHELRLTPNEHLLLYLLAAQRGSVVPYAAIVVALGLGPDAGANAVARHVTSLRRKLRDDAQQPRYIETLVGVGYRFAAEQLGSLGRGMTLPS